MKITFPRTVKDVAELAQFTPKDRQQYEQSLKYLRDLKNTEDTAWEEGREEGREEERQEIAHKLIQLSILSDEQISTTSGLSLDAVRQLRKISEG